MSQISCIFGIFSTDLTDIKRHTFEQIYTKYLCKVIYFAQSYLGNRSDAEGVAQEVFITVWEKRNELNLEKDMFSYLMILTRNKCLNRLKSKKEKCLEYDSPQLEKETINYISLESADSAILETELNEIMVRSLREMSPRVRRTFLLNRNENLKYEEIARKEGISVKAVEYRMMSALRIFRQYYKAFVKI